MTCFWDGLIKALNRHKLCLTPSFHAKKSKKRKHYCDVPSFIQELKNANCFSKDVTCNGEAPSDAQLKENVEAVASYSVRSSKNGYLCSAFDPFLFLVSQLYQVTIIHKSVYGTIVYENTKHSVRTLRVASSVGHFWS